MQSSIFNCNQAKSRTRAASDIDAQLPQKDDVSFNNKVPSNAEDVTKDDSKPWEEGHTWLVPKGKNKSDLQLNMKDATLYVEGTATLTNAWGSNGKIIVKNGGHLIVATGSNRILNGGGTTIVENGGKLTSANSTLLIDRVEKVYIDGDLTTIDYPHIQGTLYVNGNLTGKDFGSHIMNDQARLYVAGKLTSTDADLYTDGYIRVGGDIDAGNHAIYFQNTTHLIADCGIKANLVEVNSNEAEIHVNYIKCANFNQWATSKVYLNDKGLIDIDKQCRHHHGRRRGHGRGKGR